jgi:YjbR
MTANGFRKIALRMPGAIESSHMSHPDFRAHGKIFATLSEDLKSGMVKLTPELQREFIAQNPETFEPINGAWGAGGATRVVFKTADEDALGLAMTEAWKLSAVKKRKR